MTKKEVRIFVNEMSKIGDDWTEEQVEDVYGDCSLEDAIANRKASLDLFFDGIAQIINN